MSAVKDLDLNIGESNTMLMTGKTKSGETFEGSQEILVLNNESSGKK
jgi:hypothetical protein